MVYLILADLVFLIHTAFILFILFGGLTMLRWPGMIWVHFPAMVWGLLIIIYRWICPLTPLENWLLVQGGASPYTGGFLAEYLRPIIYTDGIEIPFSLAISLILVTLLINGRVYYKIIKMHFTDKKH